MMMLAASPVLHGSLTLTGVAVVIASVVLAHKTLARRSLCASLRASGLLLIASSVLATLAQLDKNSTIALFVAAAALSLPPILAAARRSVSSRRLAWTN